MIKENVKSSQLIPIASNTWGNKRRFGNFRGLGEVNGKNQESDDYIDKKLFVWNLENRIYLDCIWHNFLSFMLILSWWSRI